jgi:uncharacterized repeat protein (TIGR03806 family)
VISGQEAVMQRLCRVAAIALCVLGISVSACGDELTCLWTTDTIQIDGVASEEAWNSASLISDFRIPVTLGNPKTQTRTKLLWDRQYLYLLAELEDHDLFADVTEHDGKTWDNDVFELFLKPDAKFPGYYEFHVNARGTKMDMFVPNKQSGGYEALRAANHFHWQTAVQRRGTLDDRSDRDQGWTVEGRIPWLDLMPTGGRPDPDEIWHVAFCRYDYSKDRSPELSSSARLTEVNFHRTEDYSPLRFLEPAESDPSLADWRSRPVTVASSVKGSPDPPKPYRPVRAYPQLAMSWPVDVKVEPGTKRLIAIVEKNSYGPTQIVRTTDDPASGTLEPLLDPKGVAYSITFHPQFTQNGWMYVGSNGKTGDGPNMSRVVRYQLSRSAPFQVEGDPVTIIEWESNGHNGAAVTFGLDGMLYVTSGDGTSDSDTNIVGQDLSTPLAKVLRIDIDHPAEGKMYSVPPDNPFIGTPGAVPETWAYGLRNPWRMTTDPKTGQIWVGNNGQDMWEQVYLLQRGANYGWSVYEGSHPFYLNRKLGPTPLVLPAAEHPHSESRSLTGGVVYHGTRLPELQGAYIYGDYSTGKVWAIRHDGTTVQWHREIADTQFQLSALTLDSDGELLLVDHRGGGQGGVHWLEPTPAETAPSRFPRQLSETGLFADVSGHQMAPGLIPYSVNAPLWSDGAEKDRWIALPEGGHIDLKDRWAWEFPNDTVIVKSFALERTSGRTESKAWIETRLLVRQEGEWVGYSYAWNDDQTDAELVEAAGRDVDWTLEQSSDPEPLRWHFPSRTECMVCHTRAAGFLLGLSTVQMNRVHDYGAGVQRNQLEMLEALNVLKTSWEPDARKSLKTQLTESGMKSDIADAQVASLKVKEGQRPVRSDSLLGKSPSEFQALHDPYADDQDLSLRARSYLHANCAYCHTDAGGGNAQISLEYDTALDRTRMINVAPMHHSFGIEGAKIVAAGAPEKSVLLHRLSMRGSGQMPQLGTNYIDERARDMLREWIKTVTDPTGPETK